MVKQGIGAHLPQALSTPSSVRPLQLLSLLSHVSATGCLPVQVLHAPLLQVCVPTVHSPALTPQGLVSPFLHVQPLSVTPSQSLSMLSLHTSGCGSWSPVQAPHVSPISILMQ